MHLNKIYNQLITWHQLNAFGYVGQDNLLKFKLRLRMREKGDFSDFEWDVVVLSISETATHFKGLQSIV